MVVVTTFTIDGSLPFVYLAKVTQKKIKIGMFSKRALMVLFCIGWFGVLFADQNASFELFDHCQGPLVYFSPL